MKGGKVLASELVNIFWFFCDHSSVEITHDAQNLRIFGQILLILSQYRRSFLKKHKDPQNLNNFWYLSVFRSEHYIVSPKNTFFRKFWNFVFFILHKNRHFRYFRLQFAGISFAHANVSIFEKPQSIRLNLIKKHNFKKRFTFFPKAVCVVRRIPTTSTSFSPIFCFP